MKPTPILAAAWVATAALTTGLGRSRMPGLVTNDHDKDRGCSTATLEGAYGFVRTGINNTVGPVALIGLTIFAGDGTFSGARETSSGNGNIRDWADVPPTGTYSVDPDCTGSIFSEDGTKTNNFVIVDGGNGFFLLSTLPGRTITAVGKKLNVKD